MRKFIKDYYTFRLLEMKFNPSDYLNGGNSLKIKLFELEPEIVEIVLKKITTLVDEGFIELQIDIYKPFDNAYKFAENLYKLFVLSERELSNSDRLKVFCQDRVKTICNLIINTADNTIEELRRKYPIGMPTLDNLIGDAQNRYKLEACRKFVKEYRFLPDVKFTEAAKMASPQLGLTVEEIWKIRMIDFGFLLKYGGVPGTPEWVEKVKNSWDPDKVEKDPLYDKAQDMYGFVCTILDWIEENCDGNIWKKFDDDLFQTPPTQINLDDITFNPPNIKINTGGGSGDDREGDTDLPSWNPQTS